MPFVTLWSATVESTLIGTQFFFQVTYKCQNFCYWSCVHCTTRLLRNTICTSPGRKCIIENFGKKGHFQWTSSRSSNLQMMCYLWIIQTHCFKKNPLLGWLTNRLGWIVLQLVLISNYTWIMHFFFTARENETPDNSEDIFKN